MEASQNPNFFAKVATKWQAFLARVRLKPLSADQMYPYDFKLFAWKKIGYIVFISAVLFPITMDAIFALAFIGYANQPVLGYINILRLVLRLVSGGIGLTYISLTHKGAVANMVITGAIGFYAYFLAFPVVTFLMQTILAVFLTKGTNLSYFIIMLINIAVEIAILAFVLSISPRLRRKIISTLKEFKTLNLFVALLIAILVMFGLIYLFGFFNQLINGNTTSANQQTLNYALKSWYNIIALGVFTICIAPVLEEIAIRHGLFQLIGDPVIAFVSSFFFFAQMHITATNDWPHIIGYLGGSLALCCSFVYFRYNVTYNIIIHATSNTIVFVIMLATLK